MQWFWTWEGESFGYRVDDSLFTHDGREVGRFHDDEVYGSDGRYLGELRNENRLITNRSKSMRRRAPFLPRIGGAYARYANYAGYDDFPKPDEL